MSRTADWSYQLVDLASHALLAELEVSNVRYSKRLNTSGTFRGQIQVDDRMARRGIDLYDVTMPCRRAIYALRDGQPAWGGIIWTRAYSSTDRTIDIGAADFWSYFDHRKVLPILPTPVGTDYVASRQVTYTDTEQNDLARQLVADAQAHNGGDIGIQADTSSSGIWRDRTYHGYELSTVGGALERLSQIIDGPDLMFDVGLDSDGRVTRLLRVGTPHLGQQGSPHVWEYGGNLLSYIWPSDGASMATRTFALGDGIEEGTPVAVAEDTSRYSQGWPLLETETGYSSVTTDAVLQDHADADQQSARLPVVLPTLRVRGDVSPQVGTYGPGDDGRVIIHDEFHTNALDTAMRIVEMSLAPGDGTGEQIDLTMAPLIEGPDIA